MKNKTSITYKLGISFYALLCTVILCGCNYNIVDTDKVKTAFEEAYFEGQKDALNGDVRIRKNGDSCWIWTKSCWDSGTQPTFNPSIDCDGKK